MTVAGPAPLSVPVRAPRPGETGADGCASLLTVRHPERTEVCRTEDGTAVPGQHNALAASCDHRYINP